jgi:hypothetical protein
MSEYPFPALRPAPAPRSPRSRGSVLTGPSPGPGQAPGAPAFRRRKLLAAGALAALAACSGGGDGEPAGAEEWRSETITAGNVTTVRTISGSIWGGTARLEEELSIGVEAGDDPYMLGSVRALATDGDEIFVLDQQVPAIRVYDAAGRHLRDIGKDGEGPGEFRRPESMVLGADGRIFVRDPRTGRITIFSRQGAAVGSIPVRSGFSTGTPMVVTHDGTLYNYQLLNQGADVRDWQLAMVPRFENESEEGEPIRPPELDFEEMRIEARREGSTSINSVPFAPSSSWTLAPSGAVIAGVSTDYTFEIHYPDGRVTRVEKAWRPVPVEPAEAAWQKRRATANMRSTDPEWVWNGPEVPTTKPAFSSFLADHAGRIWVNRPGAGYHTEGECLENPSIDEVSEAYSEPCWREHSTWDVFDEEGRYLGDADLPEGIQMYPAPHIDDTVFLSAFQDDLGIVLVKRYRIVLPE